MSIMNKEALEKRAQQLSRVPLQIAKTRYQALGAAQQTALDSHYTCAAGASEYTLNNPLVSLDAETKYNILGWLGTPNGIDKAVVESINGNTLKMDLYFFNRNDLVQIHHDFVVAATHEEIVAATAETLPITGGHRVQAGTEEGLVRVTFITEPEPESPILKLHITPIGDYSTYTLAVNREKYPQMDPVFSAIPFKFRPGCFNINCAPQWEPGPKPKQEPVIDYLAKDYDSFKHTLINAMKHRVPGWQATSEADFDQVLIDLFSAAADELSDYQDRVMNETYLGTARKRHSLARHARLMDYHIHQGNQASTWLAMEMATGESFNLSREFVVWTGKETRNPESVLFCKNKNTGKIFAVEGNAAYESQMDLSTFPAGLRVDFLTKNENLSLPGDLAAATLKPGEEWLLSDPPRQRKYIVRKEKDKLNIYAAHLHHYLNRMGLYTWDGAYPALKAGSITADIKIGDGSEANAKVVEEMIHDGWVTHLLIQERLNPLTGMEAGRDPTRRQLLQLVPGKKGAEAREDPLGPTDYNWYLTINWLEKDELKRNYCFTVECSGTKTEDISFFNGNLVEVYHGEPVTLAFKEPGETLLSNQYAYIRTEKQGTLCPLPGSDLAYKNTPPGGEIPPESTLEVEVLTASGISETREEVISLVHSGNTGERGDHFAVETDEEGKSRIRFGNGTQGRELPEKAEVRCRYQVGKGPEGNIGSDTLLNIPKETAYDQAVAGTILTLWNPFDVTGGRAPEPKEEIIRRAPEAYRTRQLRAITLKDYKNRAEELEEVSKASASYAWTGSWRTVQVAVDSKGTTGLKPELQRKVARHLEAVRLIGEDLEIRPPRYVPIEIEVQLCIHNHYWISDIKYHLEEEFSEGYIDGRTAFFHPDHWTFGQALRESGIIGRIQAVKGVDHVISVAMNRWNEDGPVTGGVIEVRPNEIIRVRNNPDHMEEGSITFDVKGGRQ